MKTMRKWSIRTAGKSLLLCLTATTFLALAHAEARADEVFLKGSTAGCFGNGCAPGAVDNFLGLTYSNSTFSGTTTNGFRGLGGNPNPGANVNNLGSFTLLAPLGGLPDIYTGQTFTLQVTFTAPQGIAGANQVLFVATLTGSVRNDEQGGVRVDFNNDPILFTFNDQICEPDPTGGVPGQQTTCGIGSFSISINDLAIEPGQTASLTGQLTGSQHTPVPEPATLLLLGTGLSGVAARARRRRRRGD